MAFQPFGYRFEIPSPLPPEALKAAIRARKKSWFDPTSGARGWIAGPVFCLWNSAFDRKGPMVIGKLKSDGFGSRLTGRAGSDLNGMIWGVALGLILGFVSYQQVKQGGGNLGAIWPLLLVAVLLVVGCWFAHADRRKADVLVRFLSDTASGQGHRKPKLERSLPAFTGEMVLSVNNRDCGTVDSQAVSNALEGLEADGVMILSRADEDYVQTLSLGDHFRIEWRDGDVSRHCCAKHYAREQGMPDGLSELFTCEEATDIFCAYGSGEKMPGYVTWEPMKF